MLDGERAIIGRAVKGEASAFGLLYDHYQPKIYRFVLVKTSRREEAEDLTHQVFMNAWQSIRAYRDEGFPFSSWLYRIARNQVIDYYRTAKRTLPIEDVNPEYFAEDEEHTALVEHRLDIARVMKALRKLNGDYQDVIMMRFVDDLSPKEVGAIMKKSEGAVKVIQHRALRQLKTLLA
jgi:RNA polymerase sigma-70 factor (ECF subfamily)